MGPTTMAIWLAAATRLSAAGGCRGETMSAAAACATGADAANAPPIPRKRTMVLTDGEQAMPTFESVAPARHQRSTRPRPTRPLERTRIGQQTICASENADVAR